MENTLIKNLAIAKMMKLKIYNENDKWMYKHPFYDDFKLFGRELVFHTNWNWIKKCVDYIKELDKSNFSESQIIYYNDVANLTIGSAIEQVFETLYKFSKEYNKNDQNKN
jgi:hypothetical protein